MPTVEINTNKNRKTNGEFVISYQNHGYSGVIPVINGTPRPELAMGYVSEADRDAGLKCLEQALKATDGDVYAAMQYMRNAVLVSANDITPDEVVEINGKEFLISYDNRAIYQNENEVANLSDLGEVPMVDELIKSLLVERTTRYLKEKEEKESANRAELLEWFLRNAETDDDVEAEYEEEEEEDWL